jgi:hypothetical protein
MRRNFFYIDVALDQWDAPVAGDSLRYKISPDVVVPHVLNINVKLTCFQLLWLIKSFLLACFSKVKVDGKEEPVAQVLKQLFFNCVHCFVGIIGCLVKIY